MIADPGLPEGFDRDSIGIVIVDHGSRRQESNRRHEEFVAAWRTSRSYPIVEPAHMESAAPSIGAAFEACVAAGATTVVIAPYFLGTGNHWVRDIPALAAEASSRHPDVRYLVHSVLPRARSRSCIAVRAVRGDATMSAAVNGVVVDADAATVEVQRDCARHTQPRLDGETTWRQVR